MRRNTCDETRENTRLIRSMMEEKNEGETRAKKHRRINMREETHAKKHTEIHTCDETRWKKHV